MVTALFFGTYIILQKNKFSVSSFFALPIFLSAVLGVIIGRTPELTDLISIFNLAYTLLVLLIFTHAFKSYQLQEIVAPNRKSLKYVLIIVFSATSIAFILNSYIVYSSFIYIMSAEVNLTSYKNEGEAAELIRTWVNPTFVTIANMFSGFGYVALALHFYFLVKSKYWLSLVFVLLALNIPLNGLHAMSRSSSTQFLFLYGLYALYAYHAIEKRIRNKIRRAALIIATLIITMFVIITESRFSESSFYTIESDSLIQNKSLYANFDYFSQWNENGIKVMDEFTLDKLWYGKSSSTLLNLPFKLLGYEEKSYYDLRKQSLGNMASSFNGLVATLVYDFSHFFALIFSLIYAFIVRFLGPRKGIIKLRNFLFFSVLAPAPMMFFTNNMLSTISLNMGIFYSIVIWLFLRFRFRS